MLSRAREVNAFVISDVANFYINVY